MIDPLVGLKLYFAVKLHFETKYDIFKYDGRVPNINQATLDKNVARKKLIYRLCKRFTKPFDIVQFLVAQYIYGNGTVYDVMSSEENYSKWLKFKVSSTRTIIDDFFDLDIDDIVMGAEPKIFKMIMRGSINIESATALNNIIHFVDETTDYFIFSGLSNTIVKLARFIKFDEQRVRTELNLDSYKYSVGNTLLLTQSV